MEPQKPGNSPGPGPEVVERQRIVKKQATQRVRSWTVQNEMRNILGWMTPGSALRILDSAISGEVRDCQRAVSVAVETRENTASVTREHKFLGGNEENLCVKEF